MLEMKDKKLYRKQIGKCQKSLLISNYFKCNGLNALIKREISRMNF